MEGNKEIILSDIQIKSKILTIRGMQVMLDKDLAEIYGVETKRLNEQVKRNITRFPEDFCFQLTKVEFENWKSHFATSNNNTKMGLRKIPYAFTEHGISNLASVLTSKKAIEINILIIRAFVTMRNYLLQNVEFKFYLENIEKKQLFFEIETSKNFEKIFNALENNKIELKEGIFYDGQVFDAYIFVADLIRRAQTSIILIDNYIDDSVLTLFIKRKDNVKVTIYTENISKQLNLDLNKYNSQYAIIEIKELKNCHDRFLIIDTQEIYHFGASLKDLGKKLFAFSKLEKEGFKILEKLY